MKLFRVAVCLIFFALSSAFAFAWGPIGHMTVAYVAYQHLTPAVKARVRDLLKLNPDYANWEKQIPAGTSVDDHDLILFMVASTWADDIKGEPQYSDDGSNSGNTPGGAYSSQNIGYSDLLRHRYWHFVDIPFSPDQTPLPPIPAPNAQTQIVAFRAVLSSAQPDALKSYDLVWLIHLVGDIHQPLHAIARVTQARPMGDAGGSLVKLFGNAAFHLHSYWDDLPGADCKYCADKIHCADRAMVLGKTIQPVAAKIGRNTNTADWVRESFDDARASVYRAPIGAADQPYTIAPGSQYEKDAERLARRRIAAAGQRLAQVLNEELK